MKTSAAGFTKEEVEATVAAIKDRKAAYRQTFFGETGSRVLSDLIMFCRGFESAAVPGDRDRTFMLLGRQEVYQRIIQELCLTPAQLATLYSGGRIRLVDETEEEENEDA
jgi:hypothetical protein